MGASFRNIDEIIELAGCDLLTISPTLLKELNGLNYKLDKKLDAQKTLNTDEIIHVDELTFRKMMKSDRMADEKLEEGINKFSKAIEELEAQLEERLLIIEKNNSLVTS